MATLAAKFPTDDEAQTFYALGLLAIMPRGDQSLPLRQKAGAIAERRVRAQPEASRRRALHPARLRSRGARRKALPAARAYASIAPAASHALHMPAHAFVQLG